eukprot:Lithocolla_globosa_v1_NODE_697_length_3419_cov_8.246136.p2 type:complete len:102 gc:universal NODE_697_length_3419_cov_8.246136:2610-2915(+)
MTTPKRNFQAESTTRSELPSPLIPPFLLSRGGPNRKLANRARCLNFPPESTNQSILDVYEVRSAGLGESVKRKINVLMSSSRPLVDGQASASLEPLRLPHR